MLAVLVAAAAFQCKVEQLLGRDEQHHERIHDRNCGYCGRRFSLSYPRQDIRVMMAPFSDLFVQGGFDRYHGRRYFESLAHHGIAWYQKLYHVDLLWCDLNTISIGLKNLYRTVEKLTNFLLFN